jgi:hypothetical protein
LKNENQVNNYFNYVFIVINISFFYCIAEIDYNNKNKTKFPTKTDESCYLACVDKKQGVVSIYILFLFGERFIIFFIINQDETEWNIRYRCSSELRRNIGNEGKS